MFHDVIKEKKWGYWKLHCLQHKPVLAGAVICLWKKMLITWNESACKKENWMLKNSHPLNISGLVQFVDQISELFLPDGI